MPNVRVAIAGGRLHVGPGDWEAQGVVEPRDIVVGPFAIDRCEVSEQRYKACILAGSCAPIDLRGEPGRAIAGVSLDDAERFCRFEGGRLPTSDELIFAAAGARGRRYAWGDTGVVCRRAAYGLVSGPCAWGAKGPEITGLFRDGASPEGVLDLAGNVAEWALRADGRAEVRGGSYEDAAAASLRTWNARVIPRDARLRDVGFRCAYAH